MKDCLERSENIGTKIIVEGTQTAEQVDFFKTNSNNIMMRGDYFAKPMRSEEFKAFLIKYDFNDDQISS